MVLSSCILICIFRKLQATVKIPDEAIGNATLRIVRQAAEWSTGNPNVPYLFWACADLLIDGMRTEILLNLITKYGAF